MEEAAAALLARAAGAVSRGRGDLSVLHFAASASGLSPAHLRLRSAAACPSPPHYGTPSWTESSFLLWSIPAISGSPS